MVTISLTPDQVLEIAQVFVEQENVQDLSFKAKISDMQILQKLWIAASQPTKNLMKQYIMDYSSLTNMKFLPGMPAFLRPKGPKGAK